MAYETPAVTTASESQEPVGLGIEPRSEWPKVVQGKPIDSLKPGSAVHARVLAYLLSRLDHSEREMARFYARWSVAEKQMQAYIDLPDYEKALREMNDSGKPPKVVSIVLPFTYATISTIVTYLVHVFTGRKPMFQLGSYRDDQIARSKNMEMVLDYNADHTRLIREEFQVYQDACTYGIGIRRVDWREEYGTRRKMTEIPQLDMMGAALPNRQERTAERALVYEGNIVRAQDPFMFFPDPRVPMTLVAERGEYVFWRNYEGRHTLLKDDTLTWVEAIPKKAPSTNRYSSSSRSLAAGGWSHPGQDQADPTMSSGYYQIDQGSVEIIPSELGLGEGTKPEKWLFTIGNRAQIIQAEPLGFDHDEHPVSVIEPWSVGYGFGQLGMADYMSPIQEAMGWLFNSHMDNIKRVLNDGIIYDPSAIEAQDISAMGSAGYRLRLKQAAFGRDIRTVFQQVPMADVTRTHISDINTLFMIGAMISGIDQNFMGLQDAGGRKTATEVRTSSESGASRLTALTRIISAQSVGLRKQMTLNLQQLLSEDFYVQLLGQDGIQHPIRTEDLMGDFHFPIHDGTLPLDRIAMVDAWKEIFKVVSTDPELRGAYSMPKIFEWIAELGGARNIESMRLTPRPEDAITQGLAAGNLIPTSQVAGVTPEPSRRLMGGM